MKKTNENDHPIHIVLRDWTKTNKGNKPVVAEKREKGGKHVLSKKRI